MKKILTAVVAVLLFTAANAQLLNWSPGFIRESDALVQIDMDANFGNKGLLNYDPNDVYVHIGVITNLNNAPSPWKYVKTTWGTTAAIAKAAPLDLNRWRYEINGGLRSFFGVTDPNERITHIAILFRNGSGNLAQRNDDGSDMYVPVYDDGQHVRIVQPFRKPRFVPQPESVNKTVGETITLEARSAQAGNLKLFLNGNLVGSTNGTQLVATPTLTVPGNQEVIAEVENGGNTRTDKLEFFVTSAVETAPLPPGAVDGINYLPGGTSVILVIFAPGKNLFTVTGEFNGWTQQQMKRTPDGNRWWIQLDGLTPGQEYAYQYVVDGTLRIADYNAEKVLDPWNDPWIPSVTYPNLKPYPTGFGSGIVSVLQTQKPAYNWQVPNFTRPDKRNLVVYEVLLRDFIARHDWQTMIDTLDYLKGMGVNALSVMPFNEFEGNISWGYNPSFYFAPDKYYGPENELRRFIDEAHKRGIAVIMDMVLNHSFGQSPMVQLYWDAANNRPAANSPWFNPEPKHNFNVGYDINHESQATRDFVDRVVEHWLTKYKIDGFRWDLSKGFTQNNTLGNQGAWDAYDASRVAIWKRIYDKMQSVSPGSYCILEHFAVDPEEAELANYGMMTWGNMHGSYANAHKGLASNFARVFHNSRGFAQPHLLGYAESHDEERIIYMSRVDNNTNTSNPAHNPRELNFGLRRQEMIGAFLFPLVGPKMYWQFGELGYDFSINRCENGDINSDCRTAPKPIRWDFLEDAGRARVRDVYSRLARLRTANPAWQPAFVSPAEYERDLLGAPFKVYTAKDNALSIVVVGNFGVTPQSSGAIFPKGGTWYSVLNDTTINIANPNGDLVLFNNFPPGGYYVFVDRDVSSVLPLRLLSFTGRRQARQIALEWVTDNESNTLDFIVERSFDGTHYHAAGQVAAMGDRRARTTYRFADTDAEALNFSQVMFYRLRMRDRDGSFTMSQVVAVQPGRAVSYLAVQPNPANSSSWVAFEMPQSGNVTLRIADQNGRVLQTLFSGQKEKGYHRLPLQGAVRLPAGLYFLQMETGGTVQTEKMIWTR